MRFLRILSSFRMLCTIAQPEAPHLNFRYRVRPRKKKLAVYFQDIFESTYSQAYETVTENPFLLDISQKNIEDAVSFLKKHEITGEELRQCPDVLSVLPITLEHRLRVLQESGFPRVSASYIWRYKHLVGRKIRILKLHGLLPDDANVGRNFLAALEAPENVIQRVESEMDINSEESNIYFLQNNVLKSYLQWRLGTSREEIDRMFTAHARLRNKSVKLIHTTLDILLEELEFSKEHVINNAFMIQAHPDQLRKIIETVPSLGGKPIREVLHACPSMVAASYDNFIEILRALQQAGVPDENIYQARTLFHLTGQRVKERLRQKNLSPEAREFMSDEKLMSILLRYELFVQRTMFITDQQQNSSLPHYPSSHCLLGPQKGFEGFIRGVAGFNVGNDLLNHLIRSFKRVSDGTLNVTQEELRSILKKNPHWRHVPISEVKECFELLVDYRYSPQEILSALTIVLYPSVVVKDILKKLYSQPEVLEFVQYNRLDGNNFQADGYRGKKVRKVSKAEVKLRETSLVRKYALQLCLYYLERDNHFSGDGIWLREKNTASR